MTTKLGAAIDKSSSYVQVATNGGLHMQRKALTPTIPTTAVVPNKAAIVKPDPRSFISVLANVQTCTTLLGS